MTSLYSLVRYKNSPTLCLQWCKSSLQFIRRASRNYDLDSFTTFGTFPIWSGDWIGSWFSKPNRIYLPLTLGTIIRFYASIRCILFTTSRSNLRNGITLNQKLWSWKTDRLFDQWHLYMLIVSFMIFLTMLILLVS